MREAPRVVALILAAGASSRMDMFKPLAPLGTSTLIEEAVTRFRKAGISDVRVVVGYRADELTPVLDRLNVRWVLNSGHARGMFSSVLAGIGSLEPNVEAFFLLPCDVALVNPRTIRLLLDAYDPAGLQVIHPRFGGKRGHPPLVPAAWLKGDLSPDLPGGLRSFLEAHAQEAVDVDVTDEAVLLDCDTPEEYRVLVRRRSREGVPSERECEAIWEKLQVPEPIRAHGRLVAEVARVLAVHLNQAGLALDLPLITAAGRLHDIAREQRDHARVGAGILDGMGYPRVGALVARHMDMDPGSSSVTESELIYFADKCVEEDRLVSLEERFERSMARHAHRPDILRKVRKRRDDARNIGRRVERVLGLPPEAVICRHERTIGAAAVPGCRIVYLVRHGAIQSAGEPKRFIGQLDLPLHEQGRLQAEGLTERLSGVELSAVFCSDLKRSLETAEIIAAPHGLPCVPRRDLREISLGAWEGLTFDQVRSTFPREFTSRGLDIVHTRPPEGESFLHCACRVLAAFHEIIQSTHGDILIVGHAGVNRILLCQALGLSLEHLFRIDQDYGCLNIMHYRNQLLEVRLLNAAD
jgi:alpha-ribazole phosphatase